MADVMPLARPRGAFMADDNAAVLVAHGMGQQVRFATLEQAAGVLHLSLQSREPIRVRRIRMGNNEVTRAEVAYTATDGSRREVHVYELYWAPLTESRVGLRDVMIFLWEGTRAGLRYALRGRFDRFVFGRWHHFRIEPASAGSFLAAMGVLLALALMNGVLLSILATGLLLGANVRWPSTGLIADFTVDLAIFLLTTLSCFALGVAFPQWLRERVRVPRALAFFGRFLVLLAVVVTALTGILVGWQLWLHRDPAAATFWPFSLQWSIVGDLAHFGWRAFLRIGLIWGLTLYISQLTRRFLIQYVGDVAAYVSGYKVSHFEELREQIRKASAELASAVYRAPGSRPGSYAYRRVVILGHSLGSVIAYDTLNAVIREDCLSSESCFVVDRTPLLLTIGSPLDKIAFVYRSQTETPLDVREASEASVQPLIVSYDLRPQAWVNLHSPNDPLCGSLEYYDDPEDPAYGSRGVINEVDDEATTPVAAHGEYWNGRALARHLTSAVIGRKIVPSGIRPATPAEEERTAA